MRNKKTPSDILIVDLNQYLEEECAGVDLDMNMI